MPPSSSCFKRESHYKRRYLSLPLSPPNTIIWQITEIILIKKAKSL